MGSHRTWRGRQAEPESQLPRVRAGGQLYPRPQPPHFPASGPEPPPLVSCLTHRSRLPTWRGGCAAGSRRPCPAALPSPAEELQCQRRSVCWPPHPPCANPTVLAAPCQGPPAPGLCTAGLSQDTAPHVSLPTRLPHWPPPRAPFLVFLLRPQASDTWDGAAAHFVAGVPHLPGT